MSEEKQNQQPASTQRGEPISGNPEEAQDAPLAPEINDPLRLSEASQTTEKPKIVGLHTLKSDAAAYLKEKDMSLVDIAAEISKQRRFDEETTETSKTLLLIGAIILLVAGLGIGTWLIIKGSKPSPSESPGLESPKPLIFADKREAINLKSAYRTELINLIQKTLNSPIALNTILYTPIFLEIKDKKEFLTASRFLEILEIAPPPNLMQSLEDTFMLGVFYFKKNSPFLIFKTHSFDLALSGALSWEKNMAKDLKEIMLINPPPETQRFQDKIIKNRDSRILYDASANPVLIYTFIDKKYLVIANDFDTFEEILRRFAIPANR